MTDPQIAAYAISFLAGLALILRPGLVLVSLIFRPGLLLVVLAVAATLLSLAPAEAEAVQTTWISLG